MSASTPGENASSEPDIRNKMDICAYLARAGSGHRYLEICTPITGNQYSLLDRTIFRTCHRLMYRCPQGFDDGLAVDYRSPDNDIDACLRDIRSAGFRYDVVLVDPWHEYETSYRSLEAAVRVLADGGTVVVHDCLPPVDAAAEALPQATPGCWFGVTYRAFLAFVADRDDLEHFTVDLDFGCGIIRRRRPLSRWLPLPRSMTAFLSPTAERSARAGWMALIGRLQACGDDHLAAFDFLHAHKDEMLNLVSLAEFIESRGDCFDPRRNKTSVKGRQLALS